MSDRPADGRWEQRVKDLQRMEGRMVTDDERKSFGPQYSLLVENIHDVIWAVDLDLRHVFVSPSVKNVFGSSAEEVLKKPLAEHLTKESYALAIKRFQEELEAEKNNPPDPNRSITLELEQYCNDGSTIWTEVKCAFLRDEDDRPSGVIGVTRDITDRKMAEEKLKEYQRHLDRLVKKRTAQLEQEIVERKRAEESSRMSEADYRTVFDTVNDALFIHELETGNILDVNKKMCEMFGYSLDEVKRLGIGDLSSGESPYTQEDASRWMRKAAEGNPQLFEWCAKDRHGRLFWVEVNLKSAVIGGKKHLVAVVRDITERKRAEKALRESEKNFRAIFEGAGEGILVADSETKRFKYANPAICDLLGYTQEELTCLGVPDIHPKATLEQMLNEFNALSSRAKKVVRDIPCIRKDGSLIYADIRGTPVEIGGRECNVGFFSDMTDRKRMEEALRLSEERNRILVQNSSDLTIIFTPDFTIRFISSSAEELLGYRLEEIVGMNGTDFTHPEDLSDVSTTFRRCVNSPDELLHLSHRLRHKDGSWRLFESIGQNLLDHSAIKGILVNSRDITERKRIEEEIERAQRLDSLGVLAGGIAHDFNNLLTPILANISIAKTYGTFDEDIEEMLTDAEKASLRAKSLTQRLLTFSKGDRPEKKPTSMPMLVKDVVKFALSGSNVSCNYSIPENLLFADIDEDQIGQVIHNVIVNADQAMPAGGVIEIRAENMEIGPNDRLDLKRGDYVKLSVTDQGAGIPEKHLARIFDPFFSTKEKGSGLGLSISFSVVKRHGGTIRVESESGVGTTVHLYLPTSGKGPTKQKEEKVTLRGEGRILLIDDEETILRSAKTILERMGYEVASATDGEEGIRLFHQAKESGRPFHAVITDLTIPGGMQGKEIIVHLRKIDSDIKVIVSSGYADDPVMSEYRKEGFSGAVAKPYRLNDLAKVVREVLMAGQKQRETS